MTILAGKTAFITGGTRGIGLAIAKKLDLYGARVTITGTQTTTSSKFSYIAANFENTQSIETTATYLKQNSPDILVNSAGINIINEFSKIQSDNFNKVQQINLKAPFYFCQAVLPHMREQNWGRIINITSIWSKISKPGRSSYSASKFALDGMTTALAAEVANEGILANCVSPGFIATDLTRESLGEQGMQDIAKTIPIKRLGQPEEIAELVAWLASPKNTYISGQNILIDGGFTRV